jgi:hypothetical protein
MLHGLNELSMLTRRETTRPSSATNHVMRSRRGLSWQSTARERIAGWTLWMSCILVTVSGELSIVG